MSKNYRVLARKYRPSRFSDLKGQEFLVTTLINAIKLNRVAHTILLTGIRGSGKTTTARIIAKTLNCTSPIVTENTVNPCEECNNCSAAGNHPDIIELDAASRTGVNDARDIIENTNYLPILGKFKIFIIDEVHMLSNSAFNALLKTLEEPPEHVKFIFATTELRKIPITILSRCQKFELKRLNIEQLTQHLESILSNEKIESDKEALQLIASQAEGSVRDSLSLLDLVISNANKNKITKEIVANILCFGNASQTIYLFKKIIEGETLEAIKIIQDFYYSGNDIIYVFQQMLEVVHIISKLKLKARINIFEYSNNDLENLNLLAEKMTISNLSIFWQMISKAINEIQAANNQLITSEMIIIRLCYLNNIPTPSELIKKIANIPTSDSENTSMQVQSKLKINNFEELVELFHQKREMLLYQYLINDVNLIEFEPFKIKIRHSQNVPHQFVNKVSSFLKEWTGDKWNIIVTSENGNATIADQMTTLKEEQILEASKHDLVQDILKNFDDAVLKDLIKH